jgi:hypothetical protein
LPSAYWRLYLLLLLSLIYRECCSLLLVVWLCFVRYVATGTISFASFVASLFSLGSAIR